MPDSLIALETQRDDLIAEFSKLGDLRRGSITGTGGRCGNPNCHCHGERDPGHGPHLRRYQEVNRAFLEVNEKICRVRPVEETLTPQEKKRRRPSSRKFTKK